MTAHYDPPDDVTATVFDPSDDTFGPIMAAIQAGDFADAAALLTTLDAKCRTEPVAASVTADELIGRMLDAANDYEADKIDDLLVACGYWWECPNFDGYYKVGEPCDCCGAVQGDASSAGPASTTRV
jgi:hypothetical protein